MVFRVKEPKKILWNQNIAIVFLDDKYVDIPFQFMGNQKHQNHPPEDFFIVLIGEDLNDVYGILYKKPSKEYYDTTNNINTL